MIPNVASTESMAPCVVTELHVPGDRGPVVRGISASGSGIRGVTIVVCTYRRPGSLSALLESLRLQTSKPVELLVVDASPEEEARPTQERMAEWHDVAGSVHYWRVAGSLRGLTRQRTFALQHVSCDLVLFLDDDVVLDAGCVAAMEAAHRNGAPDTAGVGCVSTNQFAPPSAVWRLRLALGIVPSLEPGRYWRSGISIPWTFAHPDQASVDGDWLPGCAMMWNTAVVRAVGFDSGMDGYAQGEDLDFSLRARRMGRLVMLAQARIEHHHQPAGRPDPFRLGYMELRNRYEIHRRALTDRSFRDVVWFVYAWTVDTLLLTRHLLTRGRAAAALQQIAGRIAAAARLCIEHRRAEPAADA